MPKKIVVIGTGYVGLPLAIMLARSGHEVIGVDIEENIVNAINEGVLHMAEDDIRSIFQEPQVRKNLHAQKTPCEADVFIISVPTPLDEKKRVADLSQVVDATGSISSYLRSGNLVIVEHKDGWLSYYAHLSEIVVESGQEVRQGELLGGAGTTGYSTGPHLHFELRYYGRPVDPHVYLP